MGPSHCHCPGAPRTLGARLQASCSPPERARGAFTCLPSTNGPAQPRGACGEGAGRALCTGTAQLFPWQNQPSKRWNLPEAGARGACAWARGTVPRSGAALLSPPLSCHVSPTSIFRLGMFKTGDRIRCCGQIETPVRKSCDSDGFFSSVSQAFDEHHLAAGVGPRTGAHPAVTLRLHTLLLHHERVGSRYERRT